MKAKKLKIRNNTAEFLIFTTQAGENTIEVMVEYDTVWLTQKMIAVLFDSSKQNIGQHLKKIFEEGELQENSVVKNFFTTAPDGKQYDTAFYNLDAIISVGYRVNSRKATQFRQWATSVLRDFAIRGYVLDKERLKNGTFLSKEYYEHLLEEIREIRASERRFYQKITDIYATAVDYDPDSHD
ncbi:MAG: virulence RhuM family protein [Ignavibacteriales bacterium]|nr:virulence RhuM family protein [Ignavibacteriales bacterium]